MHMKFEENGHQTCHDTHKEEAQGNHAVLLEVIPHGVIPEGLGLKESLVEPCDGLIGVCCHGRQHVVGREEDIDEQQHEVLAVPEAHTVVDPRAVMIHVEHTSVAHRAVVTPLWLEHVAHQAIPPALVFWIAQVKAPEDGYLPRVSSHRLDKRPQKHYEQHVKHR